jgi:hypothetical protein
MMYCTFRKSLFLLFHNLLINTQKETKEAGFDFMILSNKFQYDPVNIWENFTV